MVVLVVVGAGPRRKNVSRDELFSASAPLRFLLGLSKYVPEPTLRLLSPHRVEVSEVGGLVAVRAVGVVGVVGVLVVDLVVVVVA